MGRILSVDVFRGIIILVMVLIHIANNFFQLQSPDYLVLGMFDFVVFGFLLLIGMSVTFHYTGKFARTSLVEMLKYFGIRAVIIMCCYYGFTILAYVVRGGAFELGTLVRIFILNHLNYQILVLLPIAFYLMLTPFVIYYLTRMRGKIVYLVALGFVLYVVSYVVNFVEFDSPLRFIKSIVVGHMTWTVFPFLQWLVAYTMGIYVGSLFSQKGRVVKELLIMGGGSAVLAATFMVLYAQQGLTINVSSYKFPLSPYHLIYSIAVCFLVLLILYRNESKMKYLSFIGYLGRHSLFIYISHWVLILLLNNYLASTAMPTIATVILAVLVYLGTMVNQKYRLL